MATREHNPSPYLGAFEGADMDDALSFAKVLKRHGVFKGGGMLPRRPDEPPAHFFHFQSLDMGPSGGAHLTDPSRALFAASAEALERRLWKHAGHLRTRSVRAAEHELRMPCLAAHSFAGYGPRERAQYKELSLPKDARLRWIRGTALHTRIPFPLWCPLQTVTAHSEERGEWEPVIRFRTTSGIAAGRNTTEATLSALLELIERDAFGIAYAHRLTPPTISAESFAASSPHRARLIESCRRLRLTITFVLTPTDFPVHVVVAVLTDATGKGPALTIGARAGFDAGEAAEAAFLEALASRLYLRADAPKHMDASAQYMHNRLHAWAHSERAHTFSFFTSGNTVDLPAATLGAASAARRLSALKKHLRARGYAACTIDLKRGSAFEDVPTAIVGVVVPALHPLQLANAPAYTHGERLHTLPKELGYTPAATLNTEPHPFP